MDAMHQQSEIYSPLRSTLKVVPSPPQTVEQFNPLTKTVLSHSKIIWKFLDANLKGLFVRGQPDIYDSPATNVEKSKLSYGCLFIPAPELKNIILLKTVSSFSHDDAALNITSSIVNQLDLLAGKLQSNWKTSEPKNIIKVDLLMCLPKDKKGGDKNNAFKHVLSNELKCAHYYQNFFKIETTFGNESNMIAKVENLSKSKIRNGSEMNCLIDLFLTLNTHYKVIYTLTDENFRNLSFESCSFENVERVKYLFDFYFPECREKLITVPDINRIFDNILYHTNSEGRLGHLSEYATYYGEVKLFVELLLSKLENPAGILLKGFTHNHFASLLSSSSIETSAFEIDWLYLTENVVMPIEVGLSDNPQKPVQAIVNKITQCLIKIIPQFQLIFYSYLTKFNQINEDESRTFSEVIQNFLKIVLFLPNVSFFAFCVALKLIKDAVQNVDVRKANPAISNGFSLLIQNYGFQLKDLTFIVLDDSSKNLRLIKIDKHLNVLDVHYSIHELFQPISEESCSFLGYLRALLSLASLTAVEDLTSGRREDTPIDVDERYRKSFSLWRKKHETDLSSRNFILSPQQHRLLAETQKTHLFITGQPGTGKTALLLAKCEQMALKEDVDSVFIVFNESDSILRRSIDAYIETQASEELRSKKEVIQRYDREIEHIRKSSKFTTEERTVVVIDELYDNRNIVDDFLNFKCCWVAAVEAGQMVGTAGSLLGSDPFWLAERGGKQVFEHENLNILFRSSHHISSVSNCFIERQLQTFPASVRIPGSFSSSENHTKIKYFIDWNDPALYDISFLSEAMTRRFLFIITDQSDIASRVEMLVSAWNSTDYFVIDDFEEGENYSFSGSDFFSVLAVIDLQDFKYEYLYDINMAVTRGQYELGFLLNSALRNNLDLMNYITKYKTSYAQAFEDFIEGRVLTSDWLIPTDLDRFQFIWWQRKIEESPSEDRKRYHELFKTQSPEICLQMAIAFPGENGFADSVDAVLQSAHNACSSDESLDSKFDWVCKLGERVLRDDKSNSLSAGSLHLLYLSTCSGNVDAFKSVITFLEKHNILGNELKHLLPNASILDVALRELDEQEDKLAYNRVETAKCLFAINIPSELVWHKFDGQNIFEFAFDNYHSKSEKFGFLRILFSDVSRCDLFFTQFVGHQSDLSQDLKSDAYERWAKTGKHRSFLQVACAVEPASFERVSWAVAILRRYDGLLETELGLIIRTHTVLTRLFLGSPNYEKRDKIHDEELAKSLSLLLACSQIPDSVLMQTTDVNLDNFFKAREGADFKNIMDIAIKHELKMCTAVLLADDRRKNLFFSSEKGTYYQNYWHSQLQNLNS